jgi:hypothetical protein
VSRKRAGRRGTRSSNEHGRTVYHCSGRGSHVPVTNLERPGPAILRCPLCGLAKPVGYETRKRIAAAGLTEVDISALPF